MEKIVNVSVRMVLEGARMVRAEYAEGGQLHDWTPAMHAAAEELRAQGAVLPEAHSGRTSGEKCERCSGTGRSCSDKHCAYQWCASCKVCNGTGRKTEESDGKSETLESRAGDQVRLGGFTAEDRRSETSGLFPVSPLAANGQTEGAGAAERPPGIPASATIWAEVVDGLGRKVGAWFDERPGLTPCVRMHMFGGEARWTPRCDAEEWRGDWDPAMNESAAAQCRQLYEKGLAHLAAEATHQALAEDLEDYRPSAEELAAAADARGEEVPATGPRTEESDESHSAQDSEGVIQAHRMLANGQCAEGDNRQREGDLQELSEATRPPCIPSHIPDTDWTVIEGRAVWRELGQLHGDFSDGSYIGEDWFKKARAWGGFEPKPTLTPVDLTELLEAANKRRDYLALAPDARSPLQEDLNNRAVLAAVEKLLSSGGAP